MIAEHEPKPRERKHIRPTSAFRDPDSIIYINVGE